jgi:hypothetical protein
MTNNDRFVRVYSQSRFSQSFSIWVDRETGVNYLCGQIPYSATSITPLLDRDGKPVVSAVGSYDYK